MRDSSAVHRSNPVLDGLRVITACSTSHLARLRQPYRQRPFNSVELWAHKISDALARHPQGLERQRLIDETGLNTLQIERALTWIAEGQQDRGERG
ncbi:hypothetical protein ABZ318_29670 [Streptomyces sp. NPDC006197]|uniref:hypothetical protein n=1 Tax=Streptomyces sp. NPDC006197 TaxID=3156685 RepID=UPI0033A3B1EF